MKSTSFARQTKLNNVAGRVAYITDPKKQEEIVFHSEKNMRFSWKAYSDYEKSNQKSNVENNEGREIIIVLPHELAKDLEKLESVVDDYALMTLGENRCFEYAVHWNEDKTNLHAHIVFSERERIEGGEPKRYKRDYWYDKETNRLSKANAPGAELRYKKGDVQLDENGNPKANDNFWSRKDSHFKSRKFNQEIKDNHAEIMKKYGFDFEVFNKEKEIGQVRLGPEESRKPETYERIKEHNEQIREINKYLKENNLTVEEYREEKALEQEFIGLEKDQVRLEEKFKGQVLNKTYSRNDYLSIEEEHGWIKDVPKLVDKWQKYFERKRPDSEDFPSGLDPIQSLAYKRVLENEKPKEITTLIDRVDEDLNSVELMISSLGWEYHIKIKPQKERVLSENKNIEFNERNLRGLRDSIRERKERSFGLFEFNKRYENSKKIRDLERKEKTLSKVVEKQKPAYMFLKKLEKMTDEIGFLIQSTNEVKDNIAGFKAVEERRIEREEYQRRIDFERREKYQSLREAKTNLVERMFDEPDKVEDLFGELLKISFEEVKEEHREDMDNKGIRYFESDLPSFDDFIEEFLRTEGKSRQILEGGARPESTPRQNRRLENEMKAFESEMTGKAKSLSEKAYFEMKARIAKKRHEREYER